jgi:Na+/H+ antiporter NhaD/arsenite permease-like protein
MLMAALPLLGIYFALDSWYYRGDTRAIASVDARQRIGLAGWQNLLLLIAIVLVVFASGSWNGGTVTLLGIDCAVAGLWRDVVLLAISYISFRTTPAHIHRDNHFSWGPVREVAILFGGIFITMIPALAILRAGEGWRDAPADRNDARAQALLLAGGRAPSFLDNAPTYLTFFQYRAGGAGPASRRDAVRDLLTTHAHYLEAISCGAVFMGANTYIGNAPNFMVKSIAEHAGIRMPGFFGYIVKFALPVLIPLFLLVTFVFFR